jgi:sigma-54 dependent transcriptional regulator, acetoin dehydrogenase operon transcriptional activator AcoR
MPSNRLTEHPPGPVQAKADARHALHVSGATQAHGGTMLQWERFVCGEPITPSQVGDLVVSSWKRSASSGVDPHGASAPLAATGDDVQHLRWRHRELLRASTGLITTIKDLLVGSRSILLLTSADGVVLDVAGHPQTLGRGGDINLAQGGDWRESTVGTNGIGTALATRKPAQIHAAEHFCEGIKGWTCAAAPINEPGSNAILGVIDISGPPDSFQHNNLTLAVAAARQIEAVLTQNWTLERARLLEACLHKLSATDAAGLIAIDRRGRLVHLSGRFPVSMSVGEQLPGWDDHLSVEEWAQRLPEGLRSEWLHPVTADGQTIGAMLIVPQRARQTNIARTADNGGSEADPQRSSFARILGMSAPIAAAIHRSRQLVGKRVPVLIEGETGVGKELFARAIHGEESLQKPFITFNCGAATRELIAGELFGHVRGAFTGATNEGRPGRFELAHGGTLCLDEIGEMPLELQPVLLRALEEGVIYRLGDSQPRRVEVRLLAMTNRNLLDEVAAGRFRRDLYHRVSVTRVRVPPLRERGDDLDALVQHFNVGLAQRHGVPERIFSAGVLALLRCYAWPGNVRELRNFVESLLLTADHPEVAIDELPYEISNAGPTLATEREHTAATLDDSERITITRALIGCQGNLTQAARTLGISRSTLYRKVERYQLEGILGPGDAGETAPPAIQ